MSTINLTGSSGTTYKCEVYPMSTFGSFDDLEGVKAVYMFARARRDALTRKIKFEAVYVGQTKDVHSRLDEGHHQIDCIREKGEFHLHLSG